MSFEATEKLIHVFVRPENNESAKKGSTVVTLSNAGAIVSLL